MMTYLASDISSPPSQATSIQPGTFAPLTQNGPIGTNSPTVGSRENSKSNSRTLSTSAIIGITASAILLILFLILLGLWRRRNNRMETRDVDVVYSDSPEEPKRERWSRQAKTYFPGTPTGFIPGETYMNSFTESETGSSRSQASGFEAESNSYPKAKCTDGENWDET
ncbi:hypothetical protein CPB86DRAFT_362370 [Serendipita vermifera]|nr:hypothetical protein CPB86DRAFT_362370 [Serendipita vermifera]